jgi:O-antigen/teichoic acid export membrane protein
MSPLSLQRNWVWSLIGNSVYAGCQWGSLVVLTKLGSLEMVGRFALASAVAAPITCFAGLQLRTVQATDARREFAFSEYFGLNAITATLGLGLIALIALLGGYSHETALLIVVVGLAKALESLSEVVYGLMQQHERLDWISRSQMLRGVLAVTALAAGVALGGVLTGAIAMVAVWAIVLAAHDLCAGAATILGGCLVAGPVQIATLRDRCRSAILRLSKLAWLAFPLGFVTMLNVLNASVPRYFIAEHGGESPVGIFAACVALLGSFFLVQTAIGQAALPRLSQQFAYGDRTAFMRTSRYVMSCGAINGAIAVLVACCCGSQLLELVYSHEYAQNGMLFVWLAIAAAGQCLGNALLYLLHATRDYRSVAMISVAVAASTLLLCALFVGPVGPVGAAWSMGISSLVSIMLSLILLTRRLAHLQAVPA